jgi:hypothetical protein
MAGWGNADLIRRICAISTYTLIGLKNEIAEPLGLMTLATGYIDLLFFAGELQSGGCENIQRNASILPA